MPFCGPQSLCYNSTHYSPAEKYFAFCIAIRGPQMTEPACKLEQLQLDNGMRAVTLSNRLISVTVLPDKGADIYTLIHRPSGLDMLWKSPQGLRAPTQGRFAADSQVAWLEMYEGGWQECL